MTFSDEVVRKSYIVTENLMLLVRLFGVTIRIFSLCRTLLLWFLFYIIVILSEIQSAFSPYVYLNQFIGNSNIYHLRTVIILSFISFLKPGVSNSVHILNCIMTSVTGDPPVANCPNENRIVTADAGENEAMVTWTEITSTGNTVTINDENYRPGSNFPVGFTKVVYTITKAADGTESFCIFYVVVKGML